MLSPCGSDGRLYALNRAYLMASAPIPESAVLFSY